MTEPRLYYELADWWPLLSAPADYAEEAAIYLDALRRTVRGPLETVLELGSGGGHNASHLKAHVEMTLVDKSPGMVEVSRALNPECEHLVGDMREVRLGRAFDAVFVHDAVSYLVSLDEVRAACATAFLHTRSGGAALFVPDFTRETFAAGTKSGGHDGEGRALRYFEWTWRPDPDGATYATDFVYLLREGQRPPRAIHDRHLHGLFARKDWLDALRDAGFQASTLPYEHSSFAPDAGYELFLGFRSP